MKKYTRVEFDRILRNNMFVFTRQTGGHYIYKRGGETVVISRNIEEPIARRLIKQHHLEVKKGEWKCVKAQGTCLRNALNS